MTMNENINTQSMLPVGTLLQGGKYRIERYLSSGGFGNTYVATNTEFEEQVAIKEFFMRGISEREGDSVTVSVSNKTNTDQFSQQKDKFRKEARRLRKLRNDHIVAVHDLFEENGTAYYEMDLVKGESLGERLKRTGQPLSEAEVERILPQVLDALQVVHAQGLYHLDLKPANIMVDDTGRALLIDFGASKQMHNSDGLSVSTSSALAFTLGFAPLEQTEQNTKSFGPWTDLYALGATLYKLLTNETPPSASELLMARGPLQFPVPVSQRMQQLIAWLMKPRIDERPQCVADVLRFLSQPPTDDDETQVVSIAPKAKDDETVLVDQRQSSPQPRQHAAQSQRASSATTAAAAPAVPAPEKKKQPLALYAGLGLGVVAVVVAVLMLLPSGQKDTAVNNAVDSTEIATLNDDDIAPVNDMQYTSTVKNGMGTYTYTGPVDSDMRPHGIGSAVLPNGDRYAGEFVHGVMNSTDKMNGVNSKYFFKEGDRFEGKMLNDQFLFGTYTFGEDGSSFKGTFENGQPAHGKWYDKNGKLTEET